MSVEALLLCSANEVRALRPTLEAQGLRLHLAESFPAAKELVERHLLRLALATMSATPKRLQVLPQLEVVLLGEDHPQIARRRLRDGAADWLTLPLRASEVQRMLTFHRRRQDRGQSAELTGAATLVDALNRGLKAGASEQDQRQVVRAGRVLTREELPPGNAIAAVQAAVTLAQAATDLRVNVQTDPAMRPTRLGTAKMARAVLQLLMSAVRQGATQANVSAVALRDEVQIDVYSDIPLGPSKGLSNAPIHHMLGAVGGRLELASTTGVGLQVQLSVPLA